MTVTAKAPKHFLDLDLLDKATLRSILERAKKLKTARQGQPKGMPDAGKPLDGRVLAMIFEKQSTRTRVSFDVGMRQLGGQTLLMLGSELQLNREETIADTARVLSRFVDAIMLRTSAHSNLTEMAEAATVPVINGLTRWSHPCQIMADIMTYEEHRGPVTGRTFAWLGDGNNVARSFIHAAARFDFTLRLACPDELAPPKDILDWAAREGAKVELTRDADAAARGADAIVTDTWVSMGDSEAERRHNLLAPYRVDMRRMGLAARDAVFLHCLPAHRGEEVTSEVIDGPQSVVWDEAENRLHAQKGILTWCLAD
ncbi:ornithine carbamoyltransferase [Zavarzinia compransoris]|uniref:Ornithine carbamoyltransferase n=1 Tax=Zavarzinia compransoris TaxID=1264899 RepID=A0A317DX19_9PROT|nr:ornithine carbamoyltransferase [Zavarzinia compransoris]PWR18904.1 ornithine carbamoyltransferase [Zavarzinia compransoris]TDP48900.1 ornithine carbamoyltransferase [Zavarzinia compransoris]